MKKTFFVTLVTAISLASGAVLAKDLKRKPASADRPPQFVILAFDGSLSLDFWKESTDFAKTIQTKDINGQPRDLKFTYFVNPVYYTEIPNKRNYITPGLNRTVSCIGYSNPANSFQERVRLTSKAFDLGHEIGSHANSHCDQTGKDPGNPMYGHAWGEAEWSSEFGQFNNLLFNVFKINGKPPQPMSFSQKDIVGFRAPLLAYTDGLWPTLKKYKFRYDTSRTKSDTYWPQKSSWGGWDFPLAEIKIAGSSRKTISMDYNWFYFHSNGVSIPNISEEKVNELRNQVLASYKYYFKRNYFGGRGPVQIGHHFSKWNGGAYWLAMKDFAKFVCGKPEVRCVTFKEYADWLDGRVADGKYTGYRNGDFSKLPDDGTIKNIATPVLAEIRLDMGNNSFEAVVPETDKRLMETMRWKTQLSVNFENMNDEVISKEAVIQKVGVGNTAFVRASLVNQTGMALDSQTYKIENIGTDKEKVSDYALESKSMMPEGVDAHELGAEPDYK